MSAGVKWRPELTDEESRFLAQIPKATLFVIARQLAAQAANWATIAEDRHDDLLSVLIYEWDLQHRNGNVPQPLPKWMRTKI